jgi:uncharacterized protein (DUF433 family)
MSTATVYPHLTFDADGTARIGDTRYKVIHLAGEHHYYGWPAEELLRQHPDLKPEEVYSALTYFYDHRDEIVAKMEDVAAEVERLRAGQTPTRDELLRRWSQRAT